MNSYQQHRICGISSSSHSVRQLSRVQLHRCRNSKGKQITCNRQLALCRVAEIVQDKQYDQIVGGPGTSYGDGRVVKVPIDRIRNFSIIAHIDHGKSTIADQLLLKTGAVSAKEAKAQFLDGMDLERERGITIKLNTARMKYTASDGQLYSLNLIDTPGHVDFGYEVSRSLAACEAAILVVDASQGVEAQTLANVWLAVENDLEIIPVLNKIDLPAADPERVKQEIEQTVGIDCSNAILASAKQGIGIEEILEAIVERCPAPQNRLQEPVQALVYDSNYDNYRGVICQVRVTSGMLQKGDEVKFMNSKFVGKIDWMAVKAPGEVEVQSLYAGEVGMLSATVKDVKEARVGDTITATRDPIDTPLPGYREAMPMVFCGMFPVENAEYNKLREALERLQTNDAALAFEPEKNGAMGNGFRCGFLGMLHMDIIQERLEREYDVGLIISAPSVAYDITLSDQTKKTITSPSQIEDWQRVRQVEEPWTKVEIIMPEEYIGPVIDLCNRRRGVFVNMQFMGAGRNQLVFELPLMEVITNFFDELKSKTRGYASLEYQNIGMREGDLVKLDIAINGVVADALSAIVHKSQERAFGKNLCGKLKELIPRQQFKVPIQAVRGAKVVASESLPALRKDVTAKCYGGDITRKRKLLDKQREGKKRLKAVGRVNVPQEAFMSVMQVNRNE